MNRNSNASCSIELQGHAIKNQDLLVASGAVSLKGSEGLSAVDEDMAAASAVRVPCDINGPFSAHPYTFVEYSLAIVLSRKTS